jgi:branched-chain amino acid transport system substrate-binding protein
MRRITRDAARLAGAALLSSACSFILDNRARQCVTTADCVARGAAFADSVCSSSHACERACQSNADCAGADRAPSICRVDKTCARLLSDDCTTLLVDGALATSDDVVWFGVLLPLVGTNAELSIANRNAIDLARRDFEIAVSGLPPSRPGGPRRPFAFVACNDAADPQRAARHLTDDVRVPAIIGPALSGTLIDVATNVTIPRGVLLISGTATSPFITNLQGKNGLVWRTVPPDTVQARAMALVVSSVIEPALKENVLVADEPLRLAFAHKGDAYGAGIAGALFQVLRFNGMTAADNAHEYLEIDYGDVGDPALDAAADAVIAFAPHVVVVAGTVEAVTNVVAPIEARWPSALPYRPRYLLTDGMQSPELWSVIGTNADLRRRTLGTVFGTRSGLYTRFQAHYRSQVHDGSIAEQSSSANYDAAYLLAYATAAIGEPITGARLSEGLRRTVAAGGTPIDVGPERISDALTALLGGGAIDFNGAAGGYAYDAQTGEPLGDFQIWCADVDATGRAAGFVTSGLSYEAAKDALTGSIRCP